MDVVEASGWNLETPRCRLGVPADLSSLTRQVLECQIAYLFVEAVPDKLGSYELASRGDAWVREAVDRLKDLAP